MHPYETYRFTENPDLGDIHSEGRASRVGMFGERGHFKNKQSKAQTRRMIKRSDKARVEKEFLHED